MNDYFINEATSFMRDMKLNSVLQGDNIQVKMPKRERLSFLYKSYKKIDELSKLGGIIGGSRGLKFYNVRGVPILDRRADDWDILLDKDSFYKFCADNKLKNIQYGQNRISINISTGIYVGSYGYTYKTPSYLFRHDIDIISKDEIPSYVECDGYKIATIESILSEKLNIIKSSKYTENKHISDCIEIMTKIKAYSDTRSAAIFTLNANDETKSMVKGLNGILSIINAEEKEMKKS